MNTEFPDSSPTKLYEIRQLDSDGLLLASIPIEANSSAAAARDLKEIVRGTDRIEVTLDGVAMNQMTVSYWKTRVRKR